MEKLIHYLRGYVRLRVWGYSPERFMNLCSNRNILLWNIEKRGGCYCMCISLAGFWQLKAITRKTKTRVAVLERHGLPFCIPHMKKRSIFAAGLLGCLLFLHGMSHYIWAIEITGNEMLTTDVLMDFLKEEKIVCGSRKDALDIETLEQSIRREFDAVTWTSAKLEGTRLVIQIKENDRKAPAIEEKSAQGMDLLAGSDGVIVKMITRSGVPLVKEADTVAKGDILVSGAVPVYGEDMLVKEYLLCQADADIFLECTRTVQENLPLVYQHKEYTGRETKLPYLRIFGKELQLPMRMPQYEKSDCIVKEKKAALFRGLELPLSFGAYHYREYTLIEKKYTQTQAKTLCMEKLDAVEKSLHEKGVQILKKDVKIKKDSLHYTLLANLTVVEKTGVLTYTNVDLQNVGKEAQAVKEQ
jgi:similar to stage IV sporulation protein